MCHYITLIVDGIAHPELRTLMKSKGRDARPGSNRSIAGLLKAGESQYLTSSLGCDCGSALLPRIKAGTNNEAQEFLRLQRKGWSKAKIERALADRRANAEHQPQHHPDSLALWSSILQELMERPAVHRAGLLIHGYQGSVEDEDFAVERHEDPKTEIDNRLSNFREDVLQVFTKTGSR